MHYAGPSRIGSRILTLAVAEDTMVDTDGLTETMAHCLRSLWFNGLQSQEGGGGVIIVVGHGCNQKKGKHYLYVSL